MKFSTLGSHSAFSVAWVLINKIHGYVCDINKEHNICNPISNECKNKKNIHSDNSNDDSSGLANKCSSDKNSNIVSNDQNNNDNNKNCKIEIKFDTKDITILHRNDIALYYSSKKESKSDGYVGGTISSIGTINEYTG